MKLSVCITEETLQDLINLSVGLYAPLKGFMTSADYHNVVDNMCLSDNSAWTIPVTLDVPHEVFKEAVDKDILYFEYASKEVGYIKISDCFKVDLSADVKKIFKTDEMAHPGVKMEMERTEFRVGGDVTVTDEAILKNALSPAKTRDVFKMNGWKSVVGFQTRNPIHKAHEYLQRVGLELCDGLFINPIVGWKKKGDFSENAVISAYNRMVRDFYPKGRIHLAGLKTFMRYAGPREAIFHAIIRRNLGCTHFIIGRDHAGVGGYYGMYEAHELAKKVVSKHELGIELLLLKGPFYCTKCEQIVTEKTCGHDGDDLVSVSGTKMRAMLSGGEQPDKRFMRPEIAEEIIKLGDRMFIN